MIDGFPPARQPLSLRLRAGAGFGPARLSETSIAGTMPSNGSEESKALVQM